MEKTLISVEVMTKAGQEIEFADDSTHAYGTSAARSLDLHEAIDSYGEVNGAQGGTVERIIIPYGAVDDAAYAYNSQTITTPEDANCGIEEEGE